VYTSRLESDRRVFWYTIRIMVVKHVALGIAATILLGFRTEIVPVVNVAI